MILKFLLTRRSRNRSSIVTKRSMYRTTSYGRLSMLGVNVGWKWRLLLSFMMGERVEHRPEAVGHMALGPSVRVIQSERTTANFVLHAAAAFYDWIMKRLSEWLSGAIKEATGGGYVVSCDLVFSRSSFWSHFSCGCCKCCDKSPCKKGSAWVGVTSAPLPATSDSLRVTVVHSAGATNCAWKGTWQTKQTLVSYNYDDDLIWWWDQMNQKWCGEERTCIDSFKANKIPFNQ